MPRRMERHARSKADWDTEPPRSAQRAEAAAEPSRRPPARKDTRHWCRGRPGREHVPQITRVHDSFGHRGCEWTSRYDWRAVRAGDDAYAVRWACGHVETCASCGKILRDVGNIPFAECPAYPGTGTQREAAEREASEYLELWRERVPRRKRAHHRAAGLPAEAGLMMARENARAPANDPAPSRTLPAPALPQRAPRP